jgi:hypothetical protein
MSQLTMKIVTTGNFRSGKAKKPPHNDYWMCEAYGYLPNVPFPQKFSYYAAAQSEVLPAGEYECDLQLSIKDDRVTLDLDPRQARKLAASAPARPAATA